MTPVSGIALNLILLELIITSNVANKLLLKITANCVEWIVEPNLLANTFKLWKLGPCSIKIVYSTTLSLLPYTKLCISDGDPAVAVNEPVILVVIPILLGGSAQVTIVPEPWLVNTCPGFP